MTLFLFLFRATLIDVERLMRLNERWRKQEAEALQELVQRRIGYIQV